MEQDTRPSQLARYHALLRAQQPYQRLQTAAGLTTAVRSLALAGLRERHPAASEDELRVRLAVRLYGRGLAARLFGPLPSDAV